MNLMTDKWIPVIRNDGTHDTIMPWQIAEFENPVIEINAPRPDFQGALYQFLIGLLQTCFAPEDEDEWLEHWEESPSPEEIEQAFEKVETAFELYNPDGPAFMQDFSLPEGKEESVELLLIGAPGGNTIDKNTDLFLKRGVCKQLCKRCSAIELFTLQLNGPPGGAGHMAGIRGNGPVTTLLVDVKRELNLFQMLWLNILPAEDDYNKDDLLSSDVFPWLGKTKTSESCKTKVCKTGCSKCGTFPEDVNSLHCYWSMPRRIRLVSEFIKGKCDICGSYEDELVTKYITKPNGFRYVGGWNHPLTPYQRSAETLPNSSKGSKASGCYQYWVGLVLQEDIQDYHYHAAKIVSEFQGEKSPYVEQQIGLWCFGYDMEPGQAKARCWYDSRLPMFNLKKDQRKNIVDWAGELIRSAREVVNMLRKAVKSAWFRRPEDAKGSMSMIDVQFWEATETDFYLLLDKLALLPGETRMAPADVYDAWFKVLQKHVFQIFEYATMSANPEDMDLKRIVLANKDLQKKFYGNKQIKSLRAKAIKEGET